MRAGEHYAAMKNIFEVLKQKEDELKRLQNEVDALRIAARLLADDMESAVVQAVSQPPVPPNAKPTPVFATAGSGVRAAAAANGNGSGSYSAAWGNAPRQFP
jgi:hypothetical protein